MEQETIFLIHFFNIVKKHIQEGTIEHNFIVVVKEKSNTVLVHVNEDLEIY